MSYVIPPDPTEVSFLMTEPNASNPPASVPNQAQQPAQEILLDDKAAHIAYSNFARVTATPEEVIIDFALNPNPFMTGRQELPVAQKLILNFFTAKRLLMALSHTIQRHEQTYGSVELNLLRRAQPGTLQPQAGGRAQQ
jgi:hypothetical protein